MIDTGDIDVYLGLDVGKGEHHATALTPAGICFELTTPYPAVGTAIGPDVMLDPRGPDQPVTVRSADRGDLTTLAMPVKPDHSA